MAKILIVDDEDNIRKVLKGLLNKNGFKDIVDAADGKEAYEILQDENIDLVISDLNMPKMNGLELFDRVKGSGVIFIMLTAFGTIETAVNAVKSGMYDFISKPFDEKEIVNVVTKALKEKNLSEFEVEAGSDTAAIYFRTTNAEMLKIKETLGRVIKSKANVLINGETGTGKGVLASIMHELSPEKQAPFIKVNCAAIPENLIESELFGYKKGAFTGATVDKPGKFELASGGTIFLDEIGELNSDLQAKLLAVLQDKEVTRLGDTKAKKIEVRVIAATNINIKEAIKEKKFREDLYYRLNVVEFKLPPLRERKEDIPELADYFIARYSKEFGVDVKTFGPGAIDFIKSCPWKGNIRELENVMQKISIMEQENNITKEMLENYVISEDKRLDAMDGSMLGAAKSEKAKKEVEMIKAALEKTGGNKTQAAKELGISRRTLLYRIKEYDI